MSSERQQMWQQHFDQWLQPFWQTATPGLCFEVYRSGQLWADYRGGEHYPYYDLASLTKVLFTVPAMMLALEHQLWRSETLVQEVLPWWPHSQTKIVDLLTHSSGLVWWKPFYQDLIKVPTLAQRWEGLRHELETSTLIDSPKAVYSDVGFLSLAFILQALWKQPLEQIWDRAKDEFALGSNLHWNPSGVEGGGPRHPVSDYAPTEHCAWRGRRMQGEVHDENAWALGGLSSHAGLFGHCADVAKVFLTFRAAYFDSQHSLHRAVKFFTQRQIPSERGDWALGFVMPTPGASTSGQYFSSTSVGHTGFTGTSVWWDKDRDLLIVILSNRVYLGREKREFAKLRPLLHDEIVSLLRRDERN
jgi:CubicO group peptidase (beta-lactamase class C family)